MSVCLYHEFYFKICTGHSKSEMAIPTIVVPTKISLSQYI